MTEGLGDIFRNLVGSVIAKYVSIVNDHSIVAVRMLPHAEVA